MDRPRVVVCGPDAQNQALTKLLRSQAFGFDEVHAFSTDQDPPDPAEIQFSDAIVWLPGGPAASGAWADFLKAAAERYPFIPILTPEGAPATLDRLSVRTVGPTGDAQVLAREIELTLQRAWWRGVHQAGLPAFIVDRTGLVVRANVLAREQFNASNRPYRQAVEGAESPDLPPDHPIRETLSTGRGVSKFHEYHGSGGDWRSAYLICSPIFGRGGAVGAVAVLLRDMTRWAAIVEAAAGFARATTEKELVRVIAEQATRLDYRRVRLKKFDPIKRVLVGQWAVGFKDPRLQAKYIQGFAISVAEDPLSYEALLYEFPRLCVYVSGELPSPPGYDATGYNLMRYTDRRLHETELEKEDVNRWIDAPLLVPDPDGTGGVRREPWGILTVDRGEESDRLGPQDAADVMLFASLAAAAVGVLQQRLGRDQTHMELFREVTRKLVELVQQVVRAPAEAGDRPPPMLPRVMQLLLKVYADITGADVVYYRERDHKGMVLREDLKPVWRGKDGDAHTNGEPRVEIPYRLQPKEGFSSYLFDQAGPDGRIDPADRPGPLFKADTQASAQSDLDRLPRDRFSDKEIRFLTEYRSAVYIPLVVGDRLRGTIIGVSKDPNAFPPGDLHAPVCRCMDTAELWLELAELHDRRLTWLDVLRTVLDVLPLLADARRRPHEEALLAGLAALLTCGGSLGWNRCLVFICPDHAIGMAELAYACGGLGFDHERRMEAAGAYNHRLRELIKLRTEKPEPGEPGDLDPLYQQCVADPRSRGEPIRILFGPHAPEGPRSPLHGLLEHDYSQTLPQPIPLKFSRGAWEGQMNNRFPGLFCTDEGLMAFPLYCAYDSTRQPLGVVVLDMPYRPGRTEELIAATRVVLELAADILTARSTERKTWGWLGGLVNLLHTGKEGDLYFHWTTLLHDLKRLLRVVRETEVRELVDSADQVQKQLDDFEPIIERYSSTQHAVRQRLGLEDNTVKDLRAHLNRWADEVSSQPRFRSYLTIHREWGSVADVALPCDGELLNNVLDCLIENAYEAACKAGHPSVVVTISADRQELEGSNINKVLSLRVSDDGPGLRPEDAPYLFISGFSRHASPSVDGSSPVKGKGLALARSLLFACQGDLQLEQPPQKAGRPDMLSATFVLRFGMKSSETLRNRREPSHAKQVADRP